MHSVQSLFCYLAFFMCSYIEFHLTISQSHIYTLMRLDDGGVDRVMIKHFRNNNASTRERNTI
ncbi:hypothetical protein Hanom_Chr14g01290211 [Helianthus anomalus]